MEASRRLPGLDLLRALAIVWVMLFHSYFVGGLGGFDPLASYGWMGVDLFFVLSGYLIGTQVLQPLQRGEPLRFGDFYLRRAFRVLPAFWVVLAVYTLWPSLGERDGTQPVWQFLTFSMNVLGDWRDHLSFSQVWSLCVEEHFYLLFPCLAWWLLRKPSARKAAVAGAAVLVFGMAVRAIAWWHGVATGADVGVRFIEGIYYPTWARLDGLLAGVALAAVAVFRPRAWLRLQSRSNSLALAGLAVIALSMWLFDDRLALAPTVLGYPLLSLGFALLVASAAGACGRLGTLDLPLVGWIARISYSLYLSHKLAFHQVQLELQRHPDVSGVGAFALYVLATLALGAALHYAVERPCLRWRDRLRRRTTMPQAAATSAASAVASVPSH